MSRIRYQQFQFRTKTLQLIDQCNEVIREYLADNLKLTLRQLYYQLVSRDIIPNQIKYYNLLGNTVTDGRLAGLIDWNAIEDRTRNLQSVGHWNTPGDIIHSCAVAFRLDKWRSQEYRPEVWIEKEALSGVFERICSELDVPYIACKGYMSQSEMWAAAMRSVKYIQAGKMVKVFHFGDHDPSGLDMTRDIEERLRMFIRHHVGDESAESNFEIERIALNMDQVRRYSPPENPAKVTDTRFATYEAEFGQSSWELDALNPRILNALVRTNIASIRNDAAWRIEVEKEARMRALLRIASDNWKHLDGHILAQWRADVERLEQEQILESYPDEPEETEDKEDDDNN